MPITGLSISILGASVVVSCNKEISTNATKKSKWQLVKTPKRYYQNNAKYTIADWSDTLIINSHKNYDAGTKGITNAAYVKVHGDNKVYTISPTV